MSQPPQGQARKIEYLRLWHAADEILRRPDNPCQIKVNEEGKASCTRSRARSRVAPDSSLCCGGCPHLGPQGCTIKALDCKLGWCWQGRNHIEGMTVNDHPTFVKIYALRREASKLGLLYASFRHEPTFED